MCLILLSTFSRRDDVVIKQLLRGELCSSCRLRLGPGQRHHHSSAQVEEVQRTEPSCRNWFIDDEVSVSLSPPGDNMHEIQKRHSLIQDWLTMDGLSQERGEVLKKHNSVAMRNWMCFCPLCSPPSSSVC